MTWSKLVFLSLSVVALISCSRSDEANSTTPDSTVGTIYAFQTQNSYTPSEVTLLADRDATCQSSFNSYSPTVTCSTFHAMLGHSTTTGLQTFISHHGLNGSHSVKLIDGTEIASTLNAFFQDGPAVMNGATWEGWSEGDWYTGVNSDRSLANTNCEDWTDGTSSKFYRVGTNRTANSWSIRGQTCDYYDDYKYVCLCY